MKRIYFYPKINYQSSESPNPYISDFENALTNNNQIVNKKYNKKGVLDFFLYVFSADIYILNWIEDLVSYRFGKLQTILFCFFLFISKILKKKIVWILHNKYSHDRKKNLWTDLIFKLMINNADLILTHSLEGIDFLRRVSPKNAGKAKYLIHPIRNIFPLKAVNIPKPYDFLIWGSLYPYKGVLEFLQFIDGAISKPNFKILIIGKCFDDDYKKALSKLLSSNIVHFDKLLTIEEIADFASQSKFILFTYKSASVLSSGTLMDSIRMRTPIIGPNIGAFKDLEKYNFLKVYQNYDDILHIYESYQQDSYQLNKEVENFCLKNSWKSIIQELQPELENIR